MSSSKENTPEVERNPKSSGTKKRPLGVSALELGPRKRLSQTDPLVHHGRHFGRTVFAFANMQALILAGLAMDQDEAPETQQEHREMRVFRKLLKMVPSLEEHLYAESTDESDILEIAMLLQKGASSAHLGHPAHPTLSRAELAKLSDLKSSELGLS